SFFLSTAWQRKQLFWRASACAAAASAASAPIGSMSAIDATPMAMHEARATRVLVDDMFLLAGCIRPWRENISCKYGGSRSRSGCTASFAPSTDAAVLVAPLLA